MPFTENEIAEHLKVLEDSFWSRRRPPLHLRKQIREGQRIAGLTIVLFVVRPSFNRPGEHLEESIAKLQYVRSQGIWRIYWKRADGKWHGYRPFPEAPTLAHALCVVEGDPNGCFFG